MHNIVGYKCEPFFLEDKKATTDRDVTGGGNHPQKAEDARTMKEDGYPLVIKLGNGTSPINEGV
jgi:hypothetical protein